MSQKVDSQPIDLTLSSMWILQPEYRSLRMALEAKGYTLRDLAQGPLIILATKGSIEIFANVQRRVIGTRSETSTRDLLIADEDLEHIYTELGVEPANLLFYEFLGVFSVTSPRNPLATMKSITLKQDIQRKIGSIFGKDLVTLGLSLTTKDGNPTALEWLHINIEPLYASASKRYRIRIVCRGKRHEVVDFVKKIEKRVSKIVEKIEGTG